MVKNPPALWESWVQSLHWEDPLEKEKATHSTILAYPWGQKESDLTERLSLHFTLLILTLCMVFVGSVTFSRALVPYGAELASLT